MTEITGVKVLFYLRERGAADWKRLCEFLDIGSSYRSSALRIVLDQLRNVGLVDFVPGADREILAGEIRLTPLWQTMQDALGMSLKKAIEEPDPRAMTIIPTFGKPRGALQNPPDVFVVMPFAQSLKPVFDDHIVPVAHKIGLSVARADDFFNSHFVMADIWEAICGARVLLADCTGRNANVFYEVGLAHAVGKQVILITQNSEDIPFDLTYLRYIKYEYTPRGMRAFEETLERTLSSGSHSPNIPFRQGLEQLRRDEQLRETLSRAHQDGIRMLEVGVTCPHCGTVGGSTHFRMATGVSGPYFSCYKCGTKTYGKA